jgi:hypothetical protein
MLVFPSPELSLFVMVFSLSKGLLAREGRMHKEPLVEF